MPESWRPPRWVEEARAEWPRPENLSLAAEEGARAAYFEMLELIRRPGVVQEVGTDTLGAVMYGAYAGKNMPDIRKIALEYGREVFFQLAGQYLLEWDPELGPADCSELKDGELSVLVQHGRYLQRQMAPNETMSTAQAKLENLTAQAIHDCGSLHGYLGFSPEERLSQHPTTVAEVANRKQIARVYEMVMQGVDTTALLAMPGIVMPRGTLDYVASFWRWLSDYPFVPDRTPGLDPTAFEQNSYIVTHALYIPTGYQRYRLEPSDSPQLLAYLRENFYAAIDLGSLDLLAEFVDNFRQLNCTADNDVQVRDGTRFMLHLYEQAGRNWTMIREEDEKGEKLLTFDLMHKPLTAYAGLHRRDMEMPAPGTYGVVAMEIMRRAQVGNFSADTGALT